jgi:hypothetical protein
MEIDDEIVEIINEHAEFSFGNVKEVSNEIIKIELRITFEENVLDTFLYMKKNDIPYIRSQNYETNIFANKLFTAIYFKISANNLNKRKQFFNFNETCNKSLAAKANQEFQKTSYFKMRCLYDPHLKKIVCNN